MPARIAPATEFFDETGRQVPEWVGASPDSPIPDRVKRRVYIRFDGRCHWTNRKILATDHWDVDHVKALCNGGQNRETNLAPILRGKPHKEKTALDVAVKKKTYRTRSKHLGLKSPSKSWNTKVRRKMNGEVVPR
jgi:5-methylcytosine-specific restriction protein A